jgi:hypothetical protein
MGISKLASKVPYVCTRRFCTLLAPCCILHTGFSLGLRLNPEDGGNKFYLNVGWFSMHYMAL